MYQQRVVTAIIILDLDLLIGLIICDGSSLVVPSRTLLPYLRGNRPFFYVFIAPTIYLFFHVRLFFAVGDPPAPHDA